MNQPRVVSLTYRIESDSHTRYVNPERMEIEVPLGRFVLSDGSLIFWPTEDFPSVADAKLAVLPFLRDWEIQAALNDALGVLRFKFDHAEIFEPPVSPADGQAVLVSASIGVAFTTRASCTVTKGRYPAPPLKFRVTTEVETAFRRWRAFLEGREPLLAMAYVIYTIFVPDKQRNRRDAARLFAVDEEVLRTLSGLSSIRGGAEDARKYRGEALQVPLADHERAWLEETVRRLIYRLGERAAGVPLAPIRMQDLPQPAPVVNPG